MKKLFILLFIGSCLVSCSESDDDGIEKDQQIPKGDESKEVLAVKPGWDIYTGGIFRYGPSIIRNEDGSIDAWFAAPGDIHGEYINNYDDDGSVDRIAISLESAIAAQRFFAEGSFYAIQVTCPNWASTNSSLTLSLYQWDTNYATTISGIPVASKSYINYHDNEYLELIHENKFPGGDYLWVLDNPSGSAGVWKRNGSKSGIINYLNGEVVSGSYDAQMLLNETSGAAYWDQIAYRRSTDGGVTWTADQMVLKPTEYSRDQLSVCDPGVAKWGEYYYLGYTSTEDNRGTDNQVYICRSQSPTGPWEKWNGNGWGGAPEPVIDYTGSADYFGAGEPCIIIKNDKIFFYYTWNAGGEEEVTTRLATGSATNPNWPSSLTFHGTVINKTDIDGSDHSDIKYRNDLQKFQAIHTASRLMASSYIVLWESADGINFRKVAELRDNLEKYLHNCGWSGDEKGHIDPAKQQYISYAYGPTWANWKTAWHPIEFTP